MDRSFVALTALLSSATFGAIWYLTAPPTTAAPVAPAQVAATSRYYTGCREARAAGVTPLHRGEPGYREGMDGDGDGVACEDYSGSFGGGGGSGWRWRGGRRRR